MKAAVVGAVLVRCRLACGVSEMFLGGCVMCSRTPAAGFIALCVAGQVLHGGGIRNARVAARGH